MDLELQSSHVEDLQKSESFYDNPVDQLFADYNNQEIGYKKYFEQTIDAVKQAQQKPEKDTADLKIIDRAWGNFQYTNDANGLREVGDLVGWDNDKARGFVRALSKVDLRVTTKRLKDNIEEVESAEEVLVQVNSNLEKLSDLTREFPSMKIEPDISRSLVTLMCSNGIQRYEQAQEIVMTQVPKEEQQRLLNRINTIKERRSSGATEAEIQRDIVANDEAWDAFVAPLNLETNLKPSDFVITINRSARPDGILGTIMDNLGQSKGSDAYVQKPATMTSRTGGNSFIPFDLYLNGRLSSERSWGLYGLNQALEPETGIVYGAVAEKNSAQALTGAAESYGNVAIVLKPEVANRATFTVGDSLNDKETRKIPFVTQEKLPEAFAAYKKVKDGEIDKTLFLDPLYVEAQIMGGVKMNDIDQLVINVSSESAWPLFRTINFFNLRMTAANVAELPFELTIRTTDKQGIETGIYHLRTQQEITEFTNQHKPEEAPKLR